MKQQVTPGLIDRYLADKCSREESRLVEEWYRSFETNSDHLSGLNAQQKDMLRRKLLGQIKSTIRRQEERVRTESRRLGIPAWIKIAAMIVLAVGLGYLAQVYFTGRHDAPPEMNRLVNRQQKLEKHILPDGSVLWLYPGSSIEQRKFEEKYREVWLSGEAFFEVSRDTLRPFLVHSGGLLTRVLGTSFAVKARPDDSTVQVSVLSGRVSVSVTEPAAGSGSSASHLVLRPNEKAVFLKAGRQLSKAGPSPGREIWAPISLSFDNVPIREVIRTLNKAFGVQVGVENEKIKNCTIKADFTDQNLPTIIDLVCKSIQAEYEIDGENIILTGNGCN